MNPHAYVYEDMELSTQLIIKEALNRGIKIDILDEETNFVRLQKGKKIEYIQQATRTSADTYISSRIMGNKVVTKKVLSECGIKVPKGKDFSRIEDAVSGFHNFSEVDIVIKPNTTNFGKGITILKKGFLFDEYKNALIKAFSFGSTIIVEEFVEGKEYRFLVIGDEVAAILHRIPANVKGDGKKSIKELVAEKNSDPVRGKGYKTPLEKIELTEVEKTFLEKQNKSVDCIPALDEIVYVRKNSNISTGGDSIDYTDDVINAYKKLAVDATKAVGAKISGVDIIINNIKTKPNSGNYVVLELNYNPALHIHSYPCRGIDRRPAAKVLDLLDMGA